MRIFGLSCLVLLTLLIYACGNVFVSASWNGGRQSIDGVVSIVQLTVISDGGVSTQVTVVTLANTLRNTTESFCGDQRTQFPVSNSVHVTFMPGQPCSSLFNVVITLH
jgi:hypothetical protein